MNIKVVTLALSTALGLTLGQVLLKLAASRGALVDVVSSPALWGGLLLYGALSVTWMLLLREIELSRAYPMVLAATFVLIPAVSLMLLGEKLGPYYPYGVVLILAGIIMVIWPIWP